MCPMWGLQTRKYLIKSPNMPSAAEAALLSSRLRHPSTSLRTGSEAVPLSESDLIRSSELCFCLVCGFPPFVQKTHKGWGTRFLCNRLNRRHSGYWNQRHSNARRVQGPFHCAADGEAVHCSGRDDIALVGRDDVRFKVRRYSLFCFAAATSFCGGVRRGRTCPAHRIPLRWRFPSVRGMFRRS